MTGWDELETSIRALVIDPVESEGGNLASQLTYKNRNDFELLTAASLQDARSILATDHVDCVVTRHDPPTIDGVKILSVLRDDYSELPILIATATAHADHVLDSSATGIVEMTNGEVHGGLVANHIESVVSRVRERQNYEAQLQASQESLQRLHRITSDPEASFTHQVHQILSLGADVFGMDIAFLARIDAEAGDFEVVAAQGDHELIQAGVTDNLSQTYCRRTIDSEADSPLAFENGSEEMEGDPASERYGLGCYMGARIDVNDDLYGTLCFADRNSRESEFSGAEKALIEIMAQWLRQQLEQREYRRELKTARDRLERTLERVDDAFFAVDTDWHVSYVNDVGTNVLQQAMGLDEDVDVVGRHLWENVPEAVETAFYHYSHQAMETQESVSFEAYFELMDVWFEVRAYPDEEGLSVYFTDITDRKQREQELERFQELLNQTERVAEVGGWEIDVATESVFWTEHLFELLGVEYDTEPPLDEALDVYHEDDRPVIEQAVEDAIEAVEPFDVELRYWKTESDLRWLRVQGMPITDDEGDVVTIRGSAQDITERKDREQTLNGLLSASRSFIEATGEDELLTAILEELRSVFGYEITSIRLHDAESGTLPPTRYSPRAHQNIPDPPSFDDDGNIVGEVFQSQDSAIIDGLNQTTGVDYGPVNSGMFVPLGNHGVLGIAALEQDAFGEEDAALVELFALTATSALDRLDRETEMRQLQRILEHLDEKVFLLDEDGELSFVTQPLASYFGKEADQLVGKRLTSLVPSNEVASCEAALQEVSAAPTEERVAVETEIRVGDGVHPVEFEFSATMSEEGSTTIAAVMHDISELTETRSNLEAERDRFKAIADTSFDLLFRIDLQGQFTYVSSGAERILGYSPEEMTGEPFTKYNTDASVQRAMGAFEAILDGGEIENVELDIITADGEAVILEVNGRPIVEDGEIVGVHGVGRDITARKDALRELEIKDKAIDRARAGITLADASQPDNPLVYVNQGFEQITGYEGSDVLGDNCRFLQGDQTDPAAVATLREHVENREPVVVELVNYRKDGTPFWNQVRITPVRDEMGDVTHFLGIQADITEQKRWERLFEVLNRVLRHNLRNDMGVIRGHGGILADSDNADSTELGETIKQYSDELIALSEKARKLEQTARSEGESTRIDPASLLTKVIESYREEYPEVTFNLSVQTNRDIFAGREIEDAVSELIENAVTHNEAPEPRVTVSVRDDGESLLLTFEDTGPGIDEMEANVVSKGAETDLEHGSGLGLWLVNWIVTRYGGSFQIEGDGDGQGGTRAFMRLPGIADDTQVRDMDQRPTILFW
jgi:PAS domain S-box-containing protein